MCVLRRCFDVRTVHDACLQAAVASQAFVARFGRELDEIRGREDNGRSE